MMPACYCSLPEVLPFAIGATVSILPLTSAHGSTYPRPGEAYLSAAIEALCGMRWNKPTESNLIDMKAWMLPCTLRSCYSLNLP